MDHSDVSSVPAHRRLSWHEVVLDAIAEELRAAVVKEMRLHDVS
jgi:hypothetical protein